MAAFAACAIIFIFVVVYLQVSSQWRRNTERFSLQLQEAADEALIRNPGINKAGRALLDGVQASHLCIISGVEVPTFESGRASSADHTSCTVNRGFLVPRESSGPNSDPASTREKLRSIPAAVLDASCGLKSGRCTVAFRNDASAAAVQDYVAMLSDSYDIGVTRFQDAKGDATYTTRLPASGVVCRSLIRVDSKQKTKRLLVYKYVANSADHPAIPFTRPDREQLRQHIADPYISDESSTQGYLHPIVASDEWAAAMSSGAFDSVVVEARDGASVLCRLTFRATTDKVAWFSPGNLSAAQFGGRDVPDVREFASRSFSSFSIDDGRDGLFWAIVSPPAPAPATNPTNSNSSNPIVLSCPPDTTVYLAAPFGSRCKDADGELDRAIVATPTPNGGASLAGYNRGTASHLVVYLQGIDRYISNSNNNNINNNGATSNSGLTPVPNSATSEADANQLPFLPAGTASDTINNFASTIEAPQNPFLAVPPTSADLVQATPDVPCVVGGSCDQDPDLPSWQLRLGVGLYSSTELARRLSEIGDSSTTSTTSTAPNLSALRRISFWPTHRIVLFCGSDEVDSPSGVPEYDFMVVLHDPSILAASLSRTAPMQRPGLSPRMDTYSLDGSLMGSVELSGLSTATAATVRPIEACIPDEVSGTVKSVVVESGRDAPLKLLVLPGTDTCGNNEGAYYGAALHVGAYTASQYGNGITDLFGNVIELASANGIALVRQGPYAATYVTTSSEPMTMPTGGACVPLTGGMKKLTVSMKIN